MTVVLLHPWPKDERAWEPQLRVLEDARAPRLYGRGASIEDWARSVVAEVDGEDLVLVGASMGGYVALAIARLAPDRVRGVALVGSRADADPPERKQFRDELIARLGDGWRPPDAVETVSNEELAAAQRAIRDRTGADDVVRALHAPLLVVVGDSDEVVSVEYARSVAALAPQGELEVVAGAGHLVALDRPDAVNSLLVPFVRRCTA